MTRVLCKGEVVSSRARGNARNAEIRGVLRKSGTDRNRSPASSSSPPLQVHSSDRLACRHCRLHPGGCSEQSGERHKSRRLHRNEEPMKEAGVHVAGGSTDGGVTARLRCGHVGGVQCVHAVAPKHQISTGGGSECAAACIPLVRCRGLPEMDAMSHGQHRIRCSAGSVAQSAAWTAGSMRGVRLKRRWCMRERRKARCRTVWGDFFGRFT